MPIYVNVQNKIIIDGICFYLKISMYLMKNYNNLLMLKSNI